MSVVELVVNKDLCISCGACVETCNLGSLKMTCKEGGYKAAYVDNSCVECGVCSKVCPSYQNDLSHYNRDNIFVGEHINSYIVHSNNDMLRVNGSSGGVITNIVLELLSKGYYKKAAVVIYDKFEGQADYTITSDVEDVILAAKSKYVPVSVKKILEFLRQDSQTPIVVVATPCQIYAINNFCKVKKIDNSNILYLGLFCEHTLNYNIYNYYSEMYGAYDAMYFRSKHQCGWPGHTILKKGEEYQLIDRGVRMKLKPYFKQNRCRYCFDKLNNMADISFGDCYMKEERSQQGKSNIIIRTSKGDAVFKQLEGLFTISECSFSDIADSQHIASKELNYARAQQQNNQIYKSFPYVSDNKLDIDKERKEYSLLQIGAKAQELKDFKKIQSQINHISLFKRIKRAFKKMILKRN